MTAPVIDDIDVDQVVKEEMTCKCDRFPDTPCDNEFDGIDSLCKECRPVCWLSSSIGETCCGNGKACKLIPLVGEQRGGYAHVRA